MANLINVDGSDDPSYRYKMPRLISKVEGRGNGVKTALMNCSDVANALKRPPQQVTKFFGCELGAMTMYEEKTDRSLVNGSFDNKTLQEALTGYIQKFVLCPACGNPETIQEMKGKKKSAVILLNCKACGACEPADNTHKLVTFIVKTMSSEGTGESKKEKRRKKKLEKAKKGKSEEGGSDEESEKKKKKKKKKKSKHKDGEKKDKKKKKKKSEVVEEDSSEKMVSEEISSELGAMTLHDVAALNTSVERVAATLSESGYEAGKVYEEVETQQVNSGLRKADRVPILFFSLFNEKSTVSGLMKSIPLLEGMIKPIEDCFLSPQDIEIELLLCMEEAIARMETQEEKAKMFELIPVLVKLLFDESLVEESTIISWHLGKLDPDKYKHLRCVVEAEDVEVMKKNAEPIIEWFQTAESDTDSEDDEDESN